jgi:ankyrin repeat protein
MRYLVENLRRWLQRHEVVEGYESVAAFFFCDSKDWQRNTYAALIKSILFQILSKHKQLFRYLDEADIKDYVTMMEEVPDAGNSEGTDFLWRCLSTILQRSKNFNFWMFVDAIDELVPDSRDKFLHQISGAIDRDLSYKVKLCFSDRVNPYSRRFKEADLLLELQSRTEINDDIRRFISAQVEDLSMNGAIPWIHQTEIEETFIDLSEGNFLQASLAWVNFRSGVSYWSPQVIKKRLEGVRKISKEATAYYCSLLQRIPEDYQEVAKIGFTWVLGSRKPLNMSELQHAVAVSSGQSSWADLVESLGFNFEVQFDQAFGFLLRVEPDQSVRFAHATVKELLTAPPENLSVENSTTISKFRIQEDNIDAELAKSCIIILSFRDFVRLRDIAREALSDRIKDYLANSLKTAEDFNNLDFSKYDDTDEEVLKQSEPDKALAQLKRSMSGTTLGDNHHALFSYCVSYWNYHCSQSGSDPEVVESLSRFVQLRQSHFFHLVAMFLGIAKVHRGLPWSMIDQFARVPPLHFAMRIGDHPAVVQNLLDHVQKVNGLDCHGWTPLGWAVVENRKDAVEVLLSNDLIIISERKASADSPLHLACLSGADINILQRLLSHPSTDINATSSQGWTVLHWCLSRHELQPVVYDLLSRKDLDLYTPDQNGCTYLEQVFHDGLFQDIALKIISRPDVPFNWFIKTPHRNPGSIGPSGSVVSFLHKASFLQWYKVEDLILSRDPSAALALEEDGMSLLGRYAFHGIEARLLQILERLPTDIFNSDKKQGSDILLLSAQQDWESIVQELIHKFGIQGSILTDHIDNHGRSLLHWASELQWKTIASLVWLEPASWLDRAAHDGRTALHVAVEHRNLLACEALIKAGANYLIRDHSRRLPIHIAAAEGHRSIAILLLECPIRDYGKDAEGRDLLHFLVMWHSDAFLRQCLRVLGSKFNVLDACRRSPLHYAAIFGNNHALKVLLEIGADPNLKDNFQSNPMHYALKAGSLACVKLLVQHGADLSLLNNFSRSALDLAISSHDAALIEYVVKLTIDQARPETVKSRLRQADMFGQTVLHRVCQWNIRQGRLMDGEEDVDSDEDDEVILELFSDEQIERLLWKQTAAKLRKLMRALRSLGAKVNVQDIHKATPLHIATKSGNEIAVEILLAFPETMPSPRDDRNLTPLDWAVVDGRTHIADMLRERGAVHSENWRERLQPLYTPWMDDLPEDSNASKDMALAFVLS